jgi:hypothetical protein
VGCPTNTQWSSTKPGESKRALHRSDKDNHKSAQANPKQVGGLLAKDVAHGFVMAVPTVMVSLIPGAMVQPAGPAERWVLLDENGKREVKHRMHEFLRFE